MLLSGETANSHSILDGFREVTLRVNTRRGYGRFAFWLGLALLEHISTIVHTAAHRTAYWAVSPLHWHENGARETGVPA